MGSQVTRGSNSLLATAPTDACQNGETAVVDVASPQAEPPVASLNSEQGALAGPCAHKPMFLEQLSVASPTSEVSWIPICWLPDQRPCTASAGHDSVACPHGQSPCAVASEQVPSATAQLKPSSEAHPCTSMESTVHAVNSIVPSSNEQGQVQTQRDADAEKLCAWLLVALPGGRMCLWSVKINLRALHELHALKSHSSQTATVSGQELVPHAPAKGSWRSGASGAGKWGDVPIAVGSRNSDSGWRGKGPVEARQVKCSADDVHLRMLFTVHAIPGLAQDRGAPRGWRVITTSYDRKTVAWELHISEEGDSARIEARHIWTGTGADLLAMCTGQVRDNRCNVRCMSCSSLQGVN
jgi:hypothetical protein